MAKADKNLKKEAEKMFSDTILHATQGMEVKEPSRKLKKVVKKASKSITKAVLKDLKKSSAKSKKKKQEKKDAAPKVESNGKE